MKRALSPLFLFLLVPVWILSFANCDLLVDGGLTPSPSDGDVTCTADDAATVCNGYACDIPEGATEGVCLTDCVAPEDCADGFECDTVNGTCEAEPQWVWVAVRSRTTTAADLDNNTPGPDLDAIELVQDAGSLWAVDVYSNQGDEGLNGNVNQDATRVMGESDAYNMDGSCVLDDDASGNAKFWSMGGGDAAIGEEGWFVTSFTNAVIADGDTITVFEVASSDCSNVGTARDDEYEVYIGNDTVDPTAMTVTDLDGDQWMSLGTTGAGGGIFSFDVVLP